MNTERLKQYTARRAASIFCLIGLFCSAAINAPAAPISETNVTFHLRSDDLKNNGAMPEAQVLNDMGRHGENISPHLVWDGAPAGTKSYVLMVYDPDAPTGSGWWHWIITDIPSSVHEIAQGAGSGRAKLPEGALQTRTDFGKPGYGGAAPPAGEKHRYIFTVYALKVDRLGLGSDTSAAVVGFMVHANVIAQASLTVMYEP